jgi:hypothetical protein
MQPTLEWRMLDHLVTRLGMMEDHEKKFINNLFEYLDPHLPFLSQCSEKQHTWLLKLFKEYKRNEVSNG